MEYFVYFASLFGSFCSSSLSVMLLWLFSLLCFHKFENSSDQLTGETPKKVIRAEERKCSGKAHEGKSATPDVPNVVNAEKYIELLENWLHEDDHVMDGAPSVEQRIQTLQRACKELAKVQLVIQSFKTQNYYNYKLSEEFQSVHSLVDRFEHIEAYVELRRFMLESFQKRFNVWLQQGKRLKIWVAEAMSLQEQIHSTACDNDAAIAQQLQLQQVVLEESTRRRGELDVCQEIARELTDLLKEINIWSEKFQRTLQAETVQNGTKRWNEVLMDSVTEEMEQISRRFAAVINLSKCFCLHLEDLLRTRRTRSRGAENSN